jgi:hypothetical protein
MGGIKKPVRRPLRPNPKQTRVTRAYTVPAAVGGLNARDAISNMPETDCIYATNVICDTDAIRIRPGHKVHASGMNGNVESLMEWNGPGSPARLFAACASSNSVFEVTTATAAVSAIAGSGLSNARWQHTVFGNGVGTNYLVMCNGEDAVQNFDGTTWTQPSITASGTTSNKFIHVMEHKERLFFTESSSTSVWYLGVNSIAGTANEFDFGSLMDLGGTISSCFRWTLDSGNGVDDLFCVYTTRGEVIVFSGANPGSASDWSLTGTFRIGAPIGRRNYFKVGSDVILLTDDGFVPVSKALMSGRTVLQEAITDKIRDLIRKETEDGKQNFGWQPILYPKRGLGIFNVPVGEGSAQVQFVVNTLNLSWSKWIGMEANCWSLLGDEVYFGGRDTVFEFGTTAASVGNTIQADIKPAFSYMGDRTGLKKFHMVRPILLTSASVTPALVVNVDFEDIAPSQTPTVNFSGSDWDVPLWDTDFWAGTIQKKTEWIGVTGVGFTGTLRFRAVTNESEIAWQATDYLWEPGEFM